MGMPHTFQPRWKFWMARIFGKRIIACDHITGKVACIIEGRQWRGHLYIIKYQMVKENE